MEDEINKLADGGQMDLSTATDDMKQISVGTREYTVKVAKTDAAREEGLQRVTDLPYNQGMLFVFEMPQRASFWMKDTYIPLDIIYIDEHGEVVEVHVDCAPMDDTLIESKTDDIAYVLEVNPDSGIRVGDELDLDDMWDDGPAELDDDDPEENRNKMLVLNAKGGAQMELQGGERIFSRPNTKTLVRLSKRAYKSKDDKDYKALGRRVFKYLDIQNNKEDDYVELPD